MKVTDSPAAVEIVSAGDIKREAATNLGSYLDEKYMFEKKWSTISLILIALFFSLYNILKQLKKINNEK